MNSEEAATQEKPRRLEDETAQYLTEIDAQLSTIAKDDEEARSVLVTNVLTEIQSRTASAACDRRTNYLIEQLVAHADVLLVLTLMQKWTVYSIFLARNRFASHIVQTLISRLSYFLKAGDIGGVEVSYMEQTVIGFCRPLIHEMQWLGKEMSASHVLRSIICLLAGLPPVAERKGKNSKHQHSVIMAETIEALQNPGEFFFSESKSFHVPDSFKTELVSGVDSLLKKSKRDIQLMIADISSCALISVLVRVLSNPRLLPNGVGCVRTQTLFNLALEIEDGTSSNSPVYYNMAGDKAGSYFLETLSEVSSLEFLVALVESNVLDTAREYALDSHGNFVIQAILKRFSTALAPAHIENLSKSQRKAVTSSSRSLLDVFLADNFLLQLMTSSKGGVLNWLLELANQSNHSTASNVICLSLLHYWQALGNSDEAIQSSEESLSSIDIHSALSSDVISKYVSERLVEVKKVEDKVDSGAKGKPKTIGESDPAPQSIRSGLPDSQQLLLARLLGTLLKSAGETKFIAAKVVTSLTKEALKVVATSGPMSKAVLDVFFEQFANSQELKNIGLSLVVIGVELSYHYVGQHVVKKAYEFSDLRGKEKWVTLLAAEKNLLNKTKEGRNTLNLVNVEMFVHDPAEWRSSVKKQMKATALFSDLTAGEETKSKVEDIASRNKKEKVDTSQTVSASHQNDDDEEEVENQEDAKKRKRKRKRPQGKTT